MAGIYKTFPSAQFGPVKFPYTQFTIKCGIRHHVHEFPHSAGGDIEKMGRKLYSFRFRIPFHDLPGSNLERDFPQLFPNRLQNLLALFDRQATLPLVVPSLGTIKCVAVDWDGVADMAEALSGDTWNVELLEDEDRASVFATPPQYGVASMLNANEELQNRAAAAGFKPSIFQKINDAVAAVDGILGRADQYNRLVAAKIHAVADLCGKADREIDALQEPINYLILEALKAVWVNAMDLSENVPGIGPAVAIFRVPTLMGIGQVSTSIYGTSERAMDLLKLNTVEDAFAIKAGTSINYVRVNGVAA